MLETKITVPPNLGKALEALKPEELRRVIAKGMVRGTLLISRRIEKERFTGTGPFAVSLHRLGIGKGDNHGYRGGNARRSITASPQANIVGDAVQTSIGSNVSYVKAHEFGFKGRVNVKSYTRSASKLGVLNRKGQLSKKSAEKLKGVLARRGMNSITVRAHKAKINIPERAMIRTGIKEHIVTIYRETQRELTSAMKRQ